MNEAIRNYQGGCVFGQLQVDEVENVTAAFSPGGNDEAPWIRELKLHMDTAKWKNCTVNFSYKTSNFHRLAASKSGEYPPRLYVWVEEKESGRIVKMRAFSSAELRTEMQGISKGEKSLKFDGHPCESLTKFVNSFDAEDPAAAAQAREAALHAMKALLREAVKRDEGING